MKDRLPALDGLRGFAALSVVLGHQAIWNFAINIPALQIILVAISAAHNAVQILFVLSGFLMAFLYPSVSKPFHFIKNRYGRIFPIYATIVIFIWLKTFITIWYFQFLILILLALVFHFIWKLLHEKLRIKNLGNILFISFIILQIAVLIFNTFYTQRHLGGNRSFSDLEKNFIFMLSNLTFTTQLVRGIPPASGVFWSLGSELLFYILYPFIVVPIIHIAKKNGIIISIVILVAVTKILLDLDNAFSSVAALNGMNIARANGFIAGVTIGTIYQSKGKVWQTIYPIISNKIFGFFSIILLIAVQLGEHIIGLGSIEFMNIFYLVTSWLIGIVILNGIVPNSMTYKIFSKKALTFLGLISYSLYLIHSEIAIWKENTYQLILSIFKSPEAADIISLTIYIVLSILISYFLFRTVEFLYFSSKKKVLATTQASISEKTKDIVKGYTRKTNALIISSTVLLLFLVYSGLYSSKLLLTRQSLPTKVSRQNELSFLQKGLILPLESKEANLSVVGLDMRYNGSAGTTLASKKSPALLKFELLDNKKKEFFSSTIHAYEIEGSPRFQFGFPTIPNSKNKNYFVKLSIIGGSKNDTAVLKTGRTSYITISTIDRSTLFHNPFKLIINRTLFVLSNPDFIFSLFFIAVVILLSQKKIILNKMK
ncbi:hypothetical protein BH09PAT1_BH09PAT1_1910 [soil metagenome]